MSTVFVNHSAASTATENPSRQDAKGAKRQSLLLFLFASLPPLRLGVKLLLRKLESAFLFHRAWTRNAQLVVVMVSALVLKVYYSTASADQLRWILAPTTALVELVSRTSFEFESHAGYISSDRSFLIATSCAGVNFLITSFLMLSLRKLWRDRSHNTRWRFIPAAVLFAYLATLVANTVRISTALWLRRMPLEISWLSGNQLHRFEGIFIYFGFLLLLFLVSEKISENASGLSSNADGLHGDPGLFQQSFFPLLVYYATTLGIPLANGLHRPGTVAADFWEHLLFVLLTPLLLILPLATFRVCRDTFRLHRDQRSAVRQAGLD